MQQSKEEAEEGAQVSMVDKDHRLRFVISVRSRLHILHNYARNLVWR